MGDTLSNRVQQVKPSATLAINAKAAALKAAGHAIISLGVGEPDFDTPQPIVDAAIKAMQSGFTRYTAVDGIPSLKQAIIEKLRRDNQLHYEPDQILVSSGAKQSIYNLLQALINPGDEVIIPAPYWVSYPDMVLLAEGNPCILETTLETQFKITPEQLAQAITSKTRLLMLNSPSNPTGVAYTRAELVALAAVLKKHPHVVVMSDDIYEPIYWGNEPFCNVVTACPQLSDRAVVINGVSKAYAMTGWRIGYAAGPKSLIAAMKKIQSQSTSNPCSISQVAAEEALNGDQTCVHAMTQVFKSRHDALLEQLNAMHGIKTLPADGAFYLFPDIRELLKEKNWVDDCVFAEALIHAGVAVVPGSAFGSPGYFRLSFAASMETLTRALERIRTLITK